MSCTNSNGQIYYSVSGYSGSNSNGGRNNFFQLGTQSTGPIPLGTYTVGAPYGSLNTGPNTMVITPNMQTTTSIQSSGRDPGSFRIHGNNSSKNASQGCIILPANRTNIPPGETVNVGL